MNRIVKFLIPFILLCGVASATTVDSNTKIVFHYDGTNGSQSSGFFDNAILPSLISRVYGSSVLSNSQLKFGATSLHIPDTDSSIEYNDNSVWEFGSGDFTVDFWFCPTELPLSGTKVLVDHWVGSGNQRGYEIDWFNSSDRLYFYYTTDGITPVTVYNTMDLSINTWVHIAIVRSGTALKMFVNGTQTGSDYNIGTSSIYNSSAIPCIGNSQEGNTGTIGYYDEFRVSKKAEWTSNFTPPTSAYSTARGQLITGGKIE